eukprot:TRINITY_DN14471_c0_g3_i1.p1 TRINITY_DN14471_c0_g3~~TRINITY_DN14471_c0_g3_i1.p1  ORF type:complete len:872 (+),score=185.02 TRINITY_DN14471_c0_g3_i1:79-2694(+)
MGERAGERGGKGASGKGKGRTKGAKEGKGGPGKGKGKGKAGAGKEQAARPGVALNREILACDGAAALLELVRQKVGAFNEVNCATALHRIAQYEGTEPPGALLRRTGEALQEAGDGSAPRTLTSIVSAVGRLGAAQDAGFLAQLATVCRERAAELDARGLASVAHGWATLAEQVGDRGGARAAAQGVCRAAAAAAATRFDEFNPLELTNFVWACAKLGISKRAPLAAAARSAAWHVEQGAYTPQGLSQTAWSYAKLGITPAADLMGKIAAASIAGLADFDLQALANVAWAAVRLQCAEAGGLLRAVGDRLLQLGEPSAASAAQLLWALARGVPGHAAVPVLARCAARAAPSMAPQQLVFAAAAAARLAGAAAEGDDAGSAAAAARLCAGPICLALRGRLGALRGEELSLALWSLSRVGGLLSASEHADCGRAVRGRLRDSASAELDWRGLGHADAALRRLGVGGGKLRRGMAQLAAAAADTMAQEAAGYNARPWAALLDHLRVRGGEGLGKGAVVLVCGELPDRATLRAASRALGKGVAVERWTRLAGDPGGAAPASHPPQGPYDACLLRHPPTGDAAFRAAATECASRLRPGAPLWVCGTVEEGMGAAIAAVADFCDPVTALPNEGGKGVRVMRCVAKGGAVPAPAAAQALTVQIPVPGGGGAAGGLKRKKKWQVAPGLFAGGGVDRMTAALLRTVPKPPPGCRALDWGSGSGVIAKALYAAEPGCEVWMLDSDAAALEVAAANVTAARRVISDSWGGAVDDTGAALQWDLILSNPPVHSGIPDDHTVLRQLLGGAARHLRPGGRLWVVAQEHVPVGLYALLAEGLASATAHDADGGRFIVWELAPAAAAGDGEEQAQADGSPPAKRARR